MTHRRPYGTRRATPYTNTSAYDYNNYLYEHHQLGSIPDGVGRYSYRIMLIALFRDYGWLNPSKTSMRSHIVLELRTLCPTIHAQRLSPTYEIARLLILEIV